MFISLIYSSTSLVDVSLDKGQHFFRLYLRREELYHLSFGIYEELGKVPRDYSSCVGLWIEELTVVSQVYEKRVRILAVHLHFLHHWELDVKVFFNELVDFSRRSTFLTEELVAWEGQNLEADLSPPSVSFDHFGVVIRGESSLAGDIGYHDKFPISEGLEVEVIAPDISDLEVEESLD